MTEVESEGAPLNTLLAWANEQYGERAALASSFSIEDVVLIHALSVAAPKVKVFTIDTGRLPPETYELMEQLTNRLGVQFETFAPRGEAVETLVNRKGHFSFRESVAARQECCAIRKVEPLGRALRGRSAWLTGLRREQATTRAELKVVEVDEKHGGIAKLNPLASWSEPQVWAYLNQHGLPYSRLYDAGYRSVGCAPCTRAVKPYEDVRAGRWWWESPEHKECGLHR